MTEACSLERSTRAMNGSYITHVIMHGIYLLSLIALFIHALVQDYLHRKIKVVRRSFILRFLYHSMMMLGVLWLSDDLFRFTIDPFTKMLRNSIFCKLLAYSVFYIPPCFYALYLIQLLLRLELSFKGSYLELSRCTSYTLRLLIALIPLSATTTLLMDGFDLDCISSWNPPDVDMQITFCVVPSSSLLIFRIYLYESLVALANVLNLTLAIILTLKLRQFMSGRNDSICGRKRAQLQSLITKNLILTVVGCVSTTLGYVGYSISGRQECLYTDILANTIVIGLASNSNKRYYKWMCGPCIWLSYKQCNDTKMALTLQMGGMQSLDRYTIKSHSSDVMTPRPESLASPSQNTKVTTPSVSSQNL